MIKTRLLYFDHFQSATEFYRTMPLDYLDKHIEITRSTERNIQPHLLNKFDIIFIERPSTHESLRVMEMCRDLGKKIIIDYDDDCLHLPNDIHPMYNMYENDKENLIKCLALADEVWVATEGIKKSFRLYNQNIHVIPNAHNDRVFHVERKRSFTNEKIVMWRGGHSHLGDIYAPGTTERIVEIINGNPDWKFYFIGQRFEFIEMRVKNANYYRHAGADTLPFYKLIHDFNPTAFFYPLSDNLLNRSKSNCSWLEATYAGAAYFGADFPEFKKPGILPLRELEDNLKKYDRDKLMAANSESWEYIRENLTATKINQKRENRIIEIMR